MSAKTIFMKKGSNDFAKTEQTFNVSTNDVSLKSVNINGIQYVVPQQVATFIDNMFAVVDDLEKQLYNANELRKEDVMKRSVSIAAALMGGNKHRVKGENLLKKDFHDSSDKGYKEFYSDVIDRVQKAIEDSWSLSERGERIEHTSINPNNAKWRG